MNLMSFCIPWAIGNLVFGYILNSFALGVFGFGLILGGLCVAIEWDIEMIDMRIELKKLKRGDK